MDAETLRLECLRLAAQRIGTLDVTLSTAKAYEQYVKPPVEPMAAPVKRGPGRPKKVANPFEE